LSKKLSPAECNYEIYDKELLAIVRAVETWRGELLGLSAPFVVLSDHKNLEYFMTTRKLTERQVRWSQTLSQFNFTLRFRSGRWGVLPDALSRRGQDIPRNAEDERLVERQFQLLKDEVLPAKQPHAAAAQSAVCAVRLAPVDTEQGDTAMPRGANLFEQPEMQDLWDQGLERDEAFHKIYDAVRSRARSFPPDIDVKASIAECDLDPRGALQFRRRTWIPDYEPLRTALVQNTHDSHVTGHPGRDSTLAILS